MMKKIFLYKEYEFEIICHTSPCKQERRLGGKRWYKVEIIQLKPTINSSPSYYEFEYDELIECINNLIESTKKSIDNIYPNNSLISKLYNIGFR